MIKGIFLIILFLIGPLSFGYAASDEYVIALYGDSNFDTHQHIIDAILSRHPNIIFHLGDIIDDAMREGEWDMLRSEIKKIRRMARFYLVRGNHDGRFKDLYKTFFPHEKAFFSMNIPNAHIIVLDSTQQLTPGSLQYKWLERDLKARRHKNIIVLLHHPVLSVGNHYLGNGPSHLIDLFKKYNVSIVLSGHDHNYQRFKKDTVYYLVSGGGGAPLMKQTKLNPFNQVFIAEYHFCEIRISKARVKVNVFGPDLNLLDQFEL